MARRLFFEKFEDRFYFCAPINVLTIINTLNSNTGNGPVVVDEASPEDVARLDVNGDGQVTPLDALIAINEINLAKYLESHPWTSHPAVGGISSIYFSPCGNNMDLMLFANRATDPGAVAIKIGKEIFTPISFDTFGKYQRWEFEVYGRGVEWLQVIGDFPDDDLLTLIAAT